MFELVQHVGVSMGTALTIVKAIDLGLSFAGALTLLSGVGAFGWFFYNAIKKKIWELGASAAAFF